MFYTRKLRFAWNQWGVVAYPFFPAIKELHRVQYTFAVVAILPGSSIEGRLPPRTGLAYFFVLSEFFEVVFATLERAGLAAVDVDVGPARVLD